MNAATQAALITKATKVFGNDQTFLSFPVTPLPFTKQQLSFLKDHDLANLSAFSSLVNFIPTGPAWLPTESRFLWDVYDSVLREAEFASSERTATEEAAYQAALAYLRTTAPDGTWQDSATVQAYRQCKDATLLLEQAYAAAQTTSEYATDPAQQQHWHDVEEPALHAELTTSRANWVLQGCKYEVEEAQNTVITLGAHSPLQTWKEWRDQFNADVDGLTSATDLSTTFPSSFAPSNALEEGAWQSFQLTADEIKVLAAEAPAEFRNRLPSGADTELAALAFEFSSATIVRGWFAPEVFRARFWRFPDPARALSDGGSPPVGECPGYVTAVVFARHIAVKTSAAPSASAAAADDTPQGGFRFPLVLASPRAQTSPPLSNAHLIGSIAQAMQARKAQAVSPPLFTLPVAPEPAAPAPQAASEANPPASTTRNIAFSLRTQLARQTPSFERMGRPAPPSQIQSRQPFQLLQRAAFTRQLTLPRPERASVLAPGPTLDVVTGQALDPAPSPASTPAPSPPVPALPVDDNIYVLAFICKPLPKCPNPDSALHWG